MRHPRFALVMALPVLLLALPGLSQVPITSLGTPITQNFDALANTGTSNAWTNGSTLPGWYAAQQSGTLSTYRADNGGSNSGALYSYGATGSTERALGSVSSGTPVTLYYGVALVNNSGSPITSFSIAYTGEQWRNGGNTTPQKLDFQYFVGTPSSIKEGTWTDFNALDFTGPIATSTAGALIGNDPANRVALTATLTEAVAPGQEIWFRWVDINDAFNDHGLGVDDLSITPNGTVATPHLSINDVSAVEGNSGTTVFEFQVSVTSGSATFDIATANGTALAGTDYVAKSETGRTATSSSPYLFQVVVNGDATIEADEVFYVNVSNVTPGVTVDKAQGAGTILNDDFTVPQLSVNNVSILEGNSGVVTVVFTASLSGPAPPGGVSFDVVTANGTATVADNDYIGVPGAAQIVIPAGETSIPLTFTVFGDTKFEADETFSVILSNLNNAFGGTLTGTCTILNDDPMPSIVINELHTDPDTSSGDANNDGIVDFTQDEFVELVNTSGGPVDMSGWTLSDAFGVRHVFPSGTVIANNCGIVVFGGGTPAGAFGGMAVQTASTGATGLGLNNGGDTVTVKVGPVTVVTYTYGAEGGDNQSLTRSPDITGPFVKHTAAPGAGGARYSPGKLLTGLPFPGCTITPIVTEIYGIQGPGAVSPLSGQYIITNQNVVTAVASDGFVIQTPDARADADVNTSNAVFVFTGSAPAVAVGDIVNVSGEVKEYFNFTEISQPVVTVTGSGAALPAPVEFTASVPDPDPVNPPPPACAIQYECWESMRIHIASGLIAGPNQYFSSDPFAEMFAVASPGRPFRTPGIAYPGLPGLPIWDGNPEVFELDPNRLGLANSVVPSGTPFSGTGILGYEFSGWEIWPTEISFGTAPQLPRPVRARTPLELTVGSLNLLNFNSTSGTYAGQLYKHSNYIRNVLNAPDVLGIAEIQNAVSLQGLADRIHADDPALTYTVHFGPVERSGIDVAFLVKNTVTNVVITQFFADKTFGGGVLHDRPPLLLEADFTGNGAPFHFAVMVNHTRSFIDVETDATVRQKRLLQAQDIAQLVQDFQTTKPATPLVLVGDYNAYEFTDGYVDVIGQIAGDAVQADNLLWAANITNPVMTKQTVNVPAAERYSYVFDGTSQSIDHALTTQATNPWVRGMQFGRGNSDAAENLLNDPTSTLRGSDHDGLVLYLMTDGNANGVPDDADAADLAITKVDIPDPVVLGGPLTYTLGISNNGSAPAYNVTVTDTLPLNATFVSATGTGWACVHAAGIVTCTRPSLAVGPAPDITIIVTAPVSGTTLTNTASVSSPIPDPVAANNTAITQTVVMAFADLSLVMSTNVATAAPGTAFTHSAKVTNLGESTATGVKLVLAIPDGAVLGALTPGCAAAGLTITCTIGSLAKNASFDAVLPLTAAVPSVYSTSGSVTGVESDPVAGNNSGSVSTVVGRLAVDPSPVTMRLPVSETTGEMVLNLTNESTFPLNFQLVELESAPIWPRATIPGLGPIWQVAEKDTDRRDSKAVPEHTRPSLAVKPLDPVAGLGFQTSLALPYGIAVNTLRSTIQIGDENNVSYSFTLSGARLDGTQNTASSWPLPEWGADMAFDARNNKFWQMNVGGDRCVHEMDPVSRSVTGNKICPAFGTNYHGLAFDPVTDTFLAGSWNDGQIRRFNRKGAILETANVGLDVAGLAYNPATRHLFVLTNSAADADLYVVSVDNYSVIRSFKITGMAPHAQAGLEADLAGNLYAINQATREVLVLPSGEAGFDSFADVAWLDENPKTGTIPVRANQPITLSFQTAGLWPGLHQATLRVNGIDPFPAKDIPINFTISYADVPENYWAEPFIHALAGAQVIDGCGSLNFCPDNPVNRAEMAVFMVRSMYGPNYVPPAATGIFVDVPITATDRTADYVEQLYRDGIVAGCRLGLGGERYYCPADLVTRAQMSVFVGAGAGLPPVNPPVHVFSDATGHWAEGFIEAIYNAGITAGCGQGVFCPELNITRAQLAVWLVVAFDIPYVPAN